MGKAVNPIVVIVALVVVFGMASFIKPAAITFVDNTTTSSLYDTGQPPTQINYGSGGGGSSSAPPDPVTIPTQTTPPTPLPAVVRSVDSLALISTISALSSKSTQKVIVGQHMERGWDMWAINNITATTGRQLMLVDGDYVEAGGGVIQYTAVNKNLINQSKQGGLVALTVYTPNPNTRTPKWNSSRDRNISFDNLMNKNSPEYSNFRYYLAQIGDGIAQLQATNVTVLIRPFHEMNGGWNWWGKRTDVQYKFLWNETYNYLVRERGFTNLIFVYAPNGRKTGDPDPGNYLYYYPGADTVDLVGVDYYSDFPEDMDATAYTQLTSLGKPFGFTEMGPKVRVAVPMNTFDNKRYVDVIKSNFPLTSWVLFWSGPSGLHSQLNVVGLLNDPWVITLSSDTPPPLVTRNPLQQPFASTSIWNMPIGSNAVYVFANISRKAGITADPDIIVLTPNAPITNVYYNSAGWNRALDRCTTAGTPIFTIPVPTNYLVAGSNSTGTPNNAAAVLQPDGRTLAQFQPFTRCTAGSGVTSAWPNPLNVDIYGDGILGAHGGSKLSSIGGTIRLGELTKTSKNITHVLKINLYSATDLSPTNGGYRWPAAQADYSYSAIYKGKVPASRMGSLYAIPIWINLASLNLQTEPGRRIAWTMQNYGAYVVDDTAWNVNGIETEQGPAGDVQQEFQAEWGFGFQSFNQNSPWVKDMNKIFDNLYVVDNNLGPGTIGGGGTPLQPLAPPLGGS